LSRNNAIGLQFDWITIGLLALMALCGLLAIYSASFNPDATSLFSMSESYGKQVMWIGICTILAIVVMNIEGEFFNQFAWVIYGAVIVLLVAVLLIGTEINGAKAWFRIGSFGLQPSEFSKLAVSLALARFIGSSKNELRHITTRFQAALIPIVPAGLILLEPDVGTLLVYLGFVFVMHREGISGNILIAGMGGIVLGIAAITMTESTFVYPFIGENTGVVLLLLIVTVVAILAFLFIRLLTLPRFRRKRIIQLCVWFVLAIGFTATVSYVMESDKILKDYQKNRIHIILGLLEDPQGSGYNLDKSKMAIGSGGFSGKGYLEGPLSKYDYVPEQNTDFIFTNIGEEWGFIGSVFVMGLFVALALRMIFLAERQRSQFSRVYGYSCAAIIFMHFLINVGMVMGLAPVIGIPLPFFSYGGSSLMGFTLLIFVMVRLDAERLTVFR
jgi:rod shape determining protein RodA